jgi:glucosamine--fructose-6-phosphate aminotransferase (isomerizing)
MLQVCALNKAWSIFVSARKIRELFSSCSKQQSVIQQLLSRKGRLIVMCSKGDASAVSPSGSCRVIEVPQIADCLQPVINIIPLQVGPSFSYFRLFLEPENLLFAPSPFIAILLLKNILLLLLQLLAYHLTVLRGFDVDQPRNLAKSVTTQ